MPLIPQLFLSEIIILFAFYTRSFLGFGAALISVPLLVHIFPIKFVVPMEVILDVVLSIFLIREELSNVRFKILIPLIIGGALGTVLGTYFLKSFANAFLLKVLGMIIVLFSLNLLVKRSYYISLPSFYGWISGLAGGVLGGMFGTSGPPYVMYLVNQIKRKEVLRASLIGLFAVDSTFRLLYYIVNGLVTKSVLMMSIYLLPALMLGILLGKVHFRIVREAIYKKFVVILLIISGLVLIIK